VQAEPVTANDASDAGDSSVDLNKKPTSRQVRRTIEAYLEMLPEDQRGPVLLSAGTFMGILHTKIEN
jgi:DNA-directed RNA polymerase specialized sigma24 family protein